MNEKIFCLGCGSDKPLEQCVLCETPQMVCPAPSIEPAEVAPKPVSAKPKRMKKQTAIAVQKQVKQAKIESLIARFRQQSAKKTPPRPHKQIVAISDYRDYAEAAVTEELRDFVSALDGACIKESQSPEARATLETIHAELSAVLNILTKGQGNATE